MIRVYADGTLIYDSMLDDPPLLSLTATLALNKSGTATIKLPRDHPKRNVFVSYRTIVEIYRDSQLLFRGRALYPTDDFFLQRTITCEGERGFFQDGLMRPRVFSDTPAQIFYDIINIYNAQVDDFKQFTAGTVDVDDPNDVIEVEIENAESCGETLEKLVERCGGYITFQTDPFGKRLVNWTKVIGTQSSQVIEYGENLLDFARTEANSDVATVIVPYGAKNSEGERLTIADVNGGQDYVIDHSYPVARGKIVRAVYWDDVKDPNALLVKAQQYLAEKQNLLASLELSAFDLSLIDKNIDSFRLGDTIHVLSKPHGVKGDYQLKEQTIDFLRPQNDKIVLGKGITTLTGAGVAGTRAAASSLYELEKIVRADYTVNQPAIVEETKLALASLIQQANDAILLEVAEQFATNGRVESAISTTMTQLKDSFEFIFNQLESRVDENDIEARRHFTEIEKYIRFVNGNIVLGEQGNEITLRIENDRLSFLDDGAEVAYFSNKKLTVLDGSFLNSLRIGSFQFLPRENGNLSLVKVGG